MSEQNSSATFLFSISAWKQRLVFWLGSIFVGLLIVMMTVLSEWAGQSYRSISLDYPWFNFVIAPVGLSFTAWLTFRFFPGSERSGIPQVKTALEITDNLSARSKLISLRIVVGKMLLPIMGLLSGASVGFGGPAVQVGASIMASLGKAVKFPPHYMEKGLILAGSAAGFAAMFSAPLAGIVFAIEEMGRAMEERISSLVLTAIIFSGVTAYAILDSYIFFDDKSLVMPWSQSWIAVPLCGIAGGFLGALFSKIIVTGGKLITLSSLPAFVVAFFCGIVIALLGYFSNGDTFGTGYQETQAILQTTQTMDPLFPFLKMLAACATVFSGIPSGIFVPSIAVGSGLGSDLATWFPVAPTTAMILLTMTAYFSGMLQSPITSFVIVMEMTGSQEILIPLMASAFFASGTSKLLNPKPLYRALCDAYNHPEESAPSAQKRIITMNIKKWLTDLVFICIIATSLWLLLINYSKPAPDISFQTISGKKIALQELRGNPVIITFWATDCPACIEEIPYFIELHDKFHNQGLEIIAVAMFYDPPNHVVAMTKAKKIPYHVALDLQKEHAQDFGNVRLIPTTFLISPEGNIILRKTGIIDVVDMQNRINEILNRPESIFSDFQWRYNEN
jgi:chloride channel protein, CIC family